MKRPILTLLFVSMMAYCYAQHIQSEVKFPPQKLKEDAAYLEQQLFNVHIYPYTELSETQYKRLFVDINNKLKDSLTATEFLKVLKPAIAYLSDEHANISLKEDLLTESFKKEDIFLPLTLSNQGNTYKVDGSVSNQTGLNPDETITFIDDQPIETAVSNCTLYTSGYANQRREKALKQFGYLYAMSIPAIRHSFTIRTSAGKKIIVPGVTLKLWQDYMNKQTGWEAGCAEAISYQKYNDAGYINACSFNINDKKMDSLKTKINAIFEQIQRDNLKYLFIDISKNGGGNSEVGSILIDYFYDKPYRTYQSDWKKSEEYLKLIRSWHIEPNDNYKSARDGQVLHFGADTVNESNNPLRFKGKVFVVIGNGTFSSAIMFGTIIKDNHIAEIAGQTPSNGHPNHFGEMYNTKLPNTGIDLRFGVKQWIRPSGKTTDNVLRPDVEVDPSVAKEELIKEVIKKAK